MSKGSMHALLKILENSRAIERSKERRYVLGPRIYDLAQAYAQRDGLRRFALPAMHRLASMTGETVCLGQVEDQWVRVLEHIEESSESPSLHISAPRGTRVHLLAGATGRVILSCWPRAQREAFLHSHPLPRFTHRSITDPETFLLAVEDTVQSGVGVDSEEYLLGVNAVAAPILGSGETLLALLWIVGFASRFKDETLANAIEQLRAECKAISAAFGAKRS
jgi:DNA-binding IclR family transcriptional regulator